MSVEYQCGRCGSTLSWNECWNCGGEGVSSHDCGEDCCCCAYPEDNVTCDVCEGVGSFPHCISSEEWCLAHPMDGRETTLRSTPEAFELPPPEGKQ
jgi:hypothetical protein